MNKAIHIFYHLFTKGHWQSLLEYHIDSIVSSELYDVSESINIGVVYHDDSDLARVKSIIKKYDKINILNKRYVNDLPIDMWCNNNFKMNVQPGEGETFSHMIDFIKKTNHESNCLFFHSKGVTSPPDSNRSQIKHFYDIGLDKNANSKTTRDFIVKTMTDNVVSNWKTIVDILDEKDFYYYVWNFFWIKSDILKKFNPYEYEKTGFGKRYKRKDRHYTARFPQNLWESVNNNNITDGKNKIPLIL